MLPDFPSDALTVPSAILHAWPVSAVFTCLARLPCLSVFLPACLPVCLPACLLVCLSIRPFVCLAA